MEKETITLAKYMINKTVGEGGTSDVVIGLDSQSGQNVAIKIMK